MEMEIKVTNLLALINLFPVGCMLGVTKNIYFVEWWPGTILFQMDTLGKEINTLAY
jgi:hypothetical protein